ncbi:putative polygalacturonase [Lupinus albus]|uniref:Putative polygalacturonase n=1 Tax=Lupinus albus TaxID=3870 RepID=A0A6A4NT76_LUPAL|nr:putative polygalacturonase [Lupinus albus]
MISCSRNHDRNHNLKYIYIYTYIFIEIHILTKRIVSIVKGGKGIVQGVIFENIIINQTDYPVHINQHYYGSKEQPQAIKVHNVTFSNINGTSTTENAIVLDCANIGCTDIKLNQISIKSVDPNKPACTICNNVQGSGTNISPLNSSCFH